MNLNSTNGESPTKEMPNTAPTNHAVEYMQSWRPFYHPVATIEELNSLPENAYGQQQILGKELLGERIIITRLKNQIIAMHGTCPHRSASLALGWVNASETAVVCPYHGFEWAADGRIQRIPAIEIDGHSLPTGSHWCVQTFPCLERYGLIWVSLDPNPRFPLLDIPEAQDPSFKTLPISIQTWQAGIGRIVEASLDTYHFAFTHQGTIGDPAHPEAPQSKVTITDDYFYIEYDIIQPDNPTVSYERASPEPGHIVSHYQFWATPNAVYLRKSSPGANFAVLAASCPIKPQLTKFYRILFQGHDIAVSAEEFMKTQDRINAEDQVIVESMHPWELSTDLDAELQVYVDRPTVSYRRWLAEMGLKFL